MRGTLICSVAVIAAGGGAAGIAAAASPPPPSRVQIIRAVRNATHSRYLWATVNVCERRRRGGGLVGVRGQMPALGFAATLSMTVQLRQYDTADGRFRFVRGATARHTATLDTVRTGVHQSGAEFPYAVDTGELDALVTFTWTRDGRRLAQVTRLTTGGHPTAAYSTPGGYSAATCRL